MLITIRRWLENPIAPDDPDAARILHVCQPSAADIVAEIEDCDNKILALQDSDFLKTKAAMLEDEKSVPGPEKREYKFVQAMIKHREDMRDSLKRLLKSNSRIGTVFAWFGFIRAKRDPTWNEDTMRDWALIYVDPERETSLTHVSQLQFFLATPLLPLQLSLTNHTHQIAPNGEKRDEPFIPNVQIRYFYTGNPHNCGTLYKAGRTTKCTAGAYSGMRSAHIAQEIGSDGRLVTKVTWEHAVAGISRTFSEKGDSGSLVLNNVDRVVGLLFGRCGLKNVSYFLHANDLVADIKEITGAKSVRLFGSDVAY